MIHITGYRIVTGSADRIAGYVLDWMAKGWVPFGGPYFETLNDLHCQAMVTYGEEIKDSLQMAY
jgi:hypothetical protein